MRLLALDIGKRRTGVASFDDATGISLPLDTLLHRSESDLLAQVLSLTKTRNVDRLVLGLPLLPSGERGEQAEYATRIGTLLSGAGFSVSYQDERYTTRSVKYGKNGAELPVAKDGDAAAACEILRSFTRS